MNDLPILIIGAGPVGLAAAAKCVRRGLPFVILEAGDEAAASIRQWSHVRLFSQWEECLDADAVALLGEQDWTEPKLAGFPTGRDLVAQYLEPLASVPAIRSRLELCSQVVRCARRGMGKTSAAGRFDAPFLATLADGRRVTGCAVLDCSGIWRNPLALPMPSVDSSEGVFLGVPDLTDPAIARQIRGKSVLVVGSGHSAMTAIVQIIERRVLGDKGDLIWVRHTAASPQRPASPANSARAALELHAEDLARRSKARLVEGLWIASIERRQERVVAIAEDQAGGQSEILADVAIVSTGFRPDHAINQDLWVALDHRWQAPAGLAELIDPEKHSCGQVPCAALADLSHPERDFFVLGSKSFGRAPNFALCKSYAHLDTVIAHLSGEEQAAPACPGARRCA